MIVSDDKSPIEIIEMIAAYHPEIRNLIEKNASVIYESFKFKGSVKPYQAAVLYSLALPYNHPDCKILEIGTGIGYSTSFLAKACPNAKIVTLNPTDAERWYAERQLGKLSLDNNIEFKADKSWDYYGAGGKMFDLIFVDGDHARIRKDLVWWENVKTNGLILFHDYTPSFSSRPQTFVFDELNKFADEVGRDFDVMVMDNQDHFGMCGFYKRATS